LPVIQLSEAPTPKVQIVLENVSTEVIHYLPGHTSGSVHPMEITLYKGAEFISPKVQVEPPEVSRERVRQLKPGESLLQVLNLSDLYGLLKPGRYLLKVRYDVSPKSYLATNYGITASAIDGPLAYVEINE
jgi:hypothetical protein